MSALSEVGIFHPHEILSDRRKRVYNDGKDTQSPDCRGKSNKRGNSFANSPKRSCNQHHRITKLFVGILLMSHLPGISPSELSTSICKYFDYLDKCHSSLNETLKNDNISEETHCLGSFDGGICWPHTKSGSLQEVQCPDYLSLGNGTSDRRVAIRFCSYNASWFGNHKDEGDEWTLTRDCFQKDTLIGSDAGDNDVFANLRIMYTVGNAISLICLIIALLLLSFFKKLHCTRNYIHMNLMVSFIIGYVVIFLKDQVMDNHYSIETSVSDLEALRDYCDDGSSTGWILTRCRLIIILMHYTTTANFFWLLVEGLYLQMLLVFVMSENKCFAGFMVFGWGAPWISVLIWVVLRMNFDNTGCWDINENLSIWWTIRAPIMITILLNFCMFINIVRIIVSKLRANNMARTDKKLRLAKSTLALIPLLGIHYMVFFAIIDEVVSADFSTMYLRLAFEMFFSSIQGTLIAVFYCFLNNEVRAEVRRAWKLWRSHQDLPRGGSTFRKSSTIGSANHSTQVTVMCSRNSATASEIPLLETSQQSRKSSNSDCDNKEDPTNRVKVNGNYTANGEYSGLKIHKKMNGLITNTIIESQPLNGHAENGETDYTPNDSFSLNST